MAARRYELSDAQWEQIKNMIPRAKTGRPPKVDRLMLNTMLWLARSGAAWADIPERYGPIRVYTAASRAVARLHSVCGRLLYDLQIKTINSMNYRFY